ncbi:RhsIA family immunity protein [Burkholderia vietnamiensis]|uniref:NTF2 fold immunity protein n=2 Tax=Burkholderiaceae TaxID=119060 RepID=UPI000A0200E9|nr:NTF2 fold immunity protein [Burkholderia vietnamiensis]MCO1433565.1 RhsIA family immunity protein [Burkholderia vietnamiensis]UQN49052.1 RhsIA family immunity protein [Burkholderia vietnamiensis]
MDDNVEQARAALRSFMLEMNRWEKDFYEKKHSALKDGGDVSGIDVRARKDLSAILEKWAFQEKTNQGRLIDLGCSDPPTYDPETDVEDSVESTDGEVIFTIRQTSGMLTISRFTMKEMAGKWMVKKKEFLNFKDKWQRSVL